MSLGKERDAVGQEPGAGAGASGPGGSDDETGLARAVLALSTRAEQGAKSVGLTLTQLRVLAAIAWGASTPSDVASALDLNLSSVARIVDRLVAIGAIERTVDEVDRRRVIQCLTAHGRELLREAEVAIAASIRSFVDLLPAADSEVAQQGLRQVRRAAAIAWRPGKTDRQQLLS